MKRFLLIFIYLFAFLGLMHAQRAEPKQGSAIPQFRMLMTNGQYFSDKEIPKNRPVVLIYFAPDCEHCIKLMDELFKKIYQLDKATIVMVTFELPKDVAWFERKYQTGQFHNIKVGTEGTTYVLRQYYRLDKTPFTAVYDKKGKLAFSYKNETPVNEMLSRFSSL